MSANPNNEGPACEKKNSDCASNICKMIYRNGEPSGKKMFGRFRRKIYKKL